MGGLEEKVRVLNAFMKAHIEVERAAAERERHRRETAGKALRERIHRNAENEILRRKWYAMTEEEREAIRKKCRELAHRDFIKHKED